MVGRPQRQPSRAAPRLPGSSSRSTPGALASAAELVRMAAEFFLPAVAHTGCDLASLAAKGQPLHDLRLSFGVCPAPPGQPRRYRAGPGKPGLPASRRYYLGAIFQHRYVPQVDSAVKRGLFVLTLFCSVETGTLQLDIAQRRQADR